MRNFFITANSIKDPDGKYTLIVKNAITLAGGAVVSDVSKAEAIIVLGGDGTLLKAAGDYLSYDIPLLGVNLGTLGYLSEADIETINESVTQLLNDRFVVEKRMMLYGLVNNGQKHEDHSLNDVVITGCGPLTLIRYEIWVNGELLNSYAADGLIIATPTGSTGYNMSAGGPIVEPRASLLVVTPICPHTLNTRSIVLSAEDEITVKILESTRDKVAVAFDGREPYLLEGGMTVKIRKSEQITQIVKLHRESFLKTLHKKLK